LSDSPIASCMLQERMHDLMKVKLYWPCRY